MIGLKLFEKFKSLPSIFSDKRMLLEIKYTDGTIKRFGPKEDADNELSYKVFTESRFLAIREITDDDPDEIGVVERYDTIRKVNLDLVREYGFVDEDK